MTETVVTGFSQSWLAFFTRGWLGSTKSKLADKASILVEARSGFTTKINDKLLPKYLLKPVYDIMQNIHTGAVAKGA